MNVYAAPIANTYGRRGKMGHRGFWTPNSGPSRALSIGHRNVTLLDAQQPSRSEFCSHKTKSVQQRLHPAWALLTLQKTWLRGLWEGVQTDSVCIASMYIDICSHEQKWSFRRTRQYCIPDISSSTPYLMLLVHGVGYAGLACFGM